MNEIVMEITPEMEGERIDKCISNYLESLSRSYIQKIIKDGKAYVNDAVVKANYKVKVDDKVQFEIPDCEEPAGKRRSLYGERICPGGAGGKRPVRAQQRPAAG